MADIADALRDIATIIGCPANADPLTDLDGLVMAVRGLAERAAGLRAQLIDVTRTNTQLRAQEQAITGNVDARIADAVAAERHAMGAWLRNPANWGQQNIASAIEHGDHIDDDAPPLPSLRMVMLARDELLRRVEALTAERDRRIDPVEHGRAVHEAYSEGFDQAPSDSRAGRHECDPKAAWIEKAYSRDHLLARVGPDVLAEVER